MAKKRTVKRKAARKPAPPPASQLRADQLVQQFADALARAQGLPVANVAFYEHLVIDIETADGKPEEIEREFRLAWSPNENWKDDTIGRRYREARARAHERRALADASPIIAVSLCSGDELRCLHVCYQYDPVELHGGLVEGFADAPAMLEALGALLAMRVGPETTIAGHNLIAFDLPKLRHAFIRAAVPLPACLAYRHPVFDTMREYGARFSIGRRDGFIALAELLDLFGIPMHKDLVSGAAVPELYAAGDYEAIVAYALLDAIAEHDLFLRMTGQEAACTPTEPGRTK